MTKLKKLLLIFAALLLNASILFGAKGYNVNYDQPKGSEITLNFDLDSYKLAQVSKNGEVYTKINFDGNVTTKDKGFAELPYIHAALQISDTKNVNIEVIEGDYKEYKLEKPLLPSRGTIYRNQNPEEITYEIAQESIKDEWYPKEMAISSEPFVLRDIRGTNVYVYPFRYNAATNTLRVYEDVKVKVTENDTQAINPLVATSNQAIPTMSGVYNSLFVNYDSNESKYANQIGEMGDILVIYTDNNGGITPLEPYIKWKQERGYTVHTKKVTVGQNVANTIKEAYQANNNILYVQLVGDWDAVKSNTGGGASAPMDPMLGCVVGTDNFPDIIIGRFSAASAADVTTQVNKAINYEKNPDSGATWYKNGIGIASNQGGKGGDDGESDQAHIENIRSNKLLSTTYSNVHQDYENNSITASIVGQHINAGTGIINYTGHGSETSFVTSGFNNGNVNSLTNGNKLPFIFSVACVNGKFHMSGDCFAEAWLKKVNGGALATFMSTINQPWDPPMRGQDYFNDLLTGGYDYSSNPGTGTSTTEADRRTTFGALAFNADVLMYAESNGSSDLETIQTWTLFGDASVQVRTDTPAVLSLSNETLLMGSDFETTVSAAGSPAKNAVVTLIQGDNIFKGTTDASGNVSIANELIAGAAKLVVTGFNLETIYQDINVVAPSGPFLTTGDVTAHNNNYGETATVDLELKNIGVDASNGISLTASTSSEFATMIDASESYSNIAADGSQTITNAISFSLTNNVPDQTPIAIDLVITDSSKKTYEKTITIMANAPKLEIEGTVEGMITSGESKNFTYTISNDGHAAITNITTTLTETDGLVVIGTPEQTIASIAAGANASVTYSVDINSGIALGTSTTMKLSIEADKEITDLYSQPIVIGDPIIIGEEFETFPPAGWTNTQWFQSTDGMNGKCAAVNYSHDGEAILETPEFSFAGGAQLSFYWIDKDFYSKGEKIEGHDYTYCEISNDAGTTWNELAVLAASSPESAYHQEIIDITEYKGTNVKVRWRDVNDGGYSAYGTGLDAVVIEHTGTVSSVEDENINIPESAVLYQNYPNPFNPTTTIKFFNKMAGNVKLAIFNAKGEVVENLVNGNMTEGFHNVEFNATNFNSGVYFYSLETNNKRFVKKMMLIK